MFGKSGCRAYEARAKVEHEVLIIEGETAAVIHRMTTNAPFTELHAA